MTYVEHIVERPDPALTDSWKDENPIEGNDLLTAATDKMLAVADPTRTKLVASTSETPTGSMVGHPDRPYPELESLVARFDGAVRPDPLLVDAAARVYAGSGHRTEPYQGEGRGAATEHSKS